MNAADAAQAVALSLSTARVSSRRTCSARSVSPPVQGDGENAFATSDFLHGVGERKTLVVREAVLLAKTGVHPQVGPLHLAGPALEQVPSAALLEDAHQWHVVPVQDLNGDGRRRGLPGVLALLDLD